MRKENLPAVQSYFKLSESEVKHLMGCNAGEGIAKIGNECIPLRIALSEYELDVIKGRKTGQKADSKAESATVFKLVSETLQDIVIKHGIIFESWTKENELVLSRMGYISEIVQHAIGAGRHKVWIRKDLLINGMVLNQTIDHYASVMEIAGSLLIAGCQADVSNYSGVDISTIINGHKIGFEYEKPSNKSTADIINKFQAAQQVHEEVYFVCTSSNQKELSEILGASVVIPRGSQLQDFIFDLLKSRRADIKLLDVSL